MIGSSAAPWGGRLAAMAIDFTFDPDIEDARLRMRAFVDEDVRPTEERLVADAPGRGDWRAELDRLRARARELDLWMPHMPREWGGVGLGPTALAAVSAEAAKTRLGVLRRELLRPRRGQHAHAAALGDRRPEEPLPETHVRGHRCGRASP